MKPSRRDIIRTGAAAAAAVAIPLNLKAAAPVLEASPTAPVPAHPLYPWYRLQYAMMGSDGRPGTHIGLRWSPIEFEDIKAGDFVANTVYPYPQTPGRLSIGEFFTWFDKSDFYAADSDACDSDGDLVPSFRVREFHPDSADFWDDPEHQRLFGRRWAFQMQFAAHNRLKTRRERDLLRFWIDQRPYGLDVAVVAPDDIYIYYERDELRERREFYNRTVGEPWLAVQI